MTKAPFYLVALPLTSPNMGWNNDTEFFDPLSQYHFEILDILERRDASGNMKVRVRCLETQQDFETTYDPQYLVIVD